MKNIVSAVFDTQAQAEQALQRLRASGIADNHVSIVAQHANDLTTGHAEVRDLDDHDNKASGMAKGALAGAGVGALFGLAALAIPGVGPFITAGALAEALGVTGGAIASGAIVGGAAGGLSGLLMDYGVSKDDAAYYEQRLHQGGVFMAVDVTGMPQNEQVVRSVLQQAGGRTSAYLA
ncbi:MAG: hypothetical protein ACO1SV_06840 [Fimbriimonas sp.]